jgi:hypothetical protein
VCSVLSSLPKRAVVFFSPLDSLGTMSQVGGVTWVEFLSVGWDCLCAMSRFRTLEGFCLSSTPCSKLISSHVRVSGFDSQLTHGTIVKYTKRE